MQGKGSFLILCAQSLRPIAAYELLGVLEKDSISRSVEVVSLDFTDLVINGIFTDPEGAAQRLTSLQGQLYAALARRGEAEFAFHGLVHIPIAFLIGHLVTDRQPVRLFDFHPGPGLVTWAWPDMQGAIPPLKVRGEPERPSRRKGVAVVRISISYKVTAAQTRAVFPHAALEVDLSVPDPERGMVRSEEQVREYGRTFRRVLDLIAQRCPAVQHIHIFYAGPVAPGISPGTTNIREHPSSRDRVELSPGIWLGH
jgi:hypothetical protein